jgi:hypothetical protein
VTPQVKELVSLLELVVSWAATTALYFAIVMLDERRLSAAQLERAWPVASRNSAIVAFGPIAILVHFVKTRAVPPARALRMFGGLLVGAVSVVAVGFFTEIATDGAMLVLQPAAPALSRFLDESSQPVAVACQIVLALSVLASVAITVRRDAEDAPPLDPRASVAIKDRP